MTATQHIIKVTEQSACFGRGGFTAFTEGRVTGYNSVLILALRLELVTAYKTADD